MKLCNPFGTFTRFEKILWIGSCVMICVLFWVTPGRDILTLVASLIGVTALVFLAKGDVKGQILTVVFSVFYGIISFRFRYFGEMITYMGMTAPMAALAAWEWIKHPFVEGENDKEYSKEYRKENSHSEVKITKLSTHKLMVLAVLTVVVTAIFYLILKYFHTNNLLMSTVSIATSFLAAALTFLRSPYYALAYAANDVVLIVLWVLATVADIVFLPMILLFVIFLINDLYGFVNWRRMQDRQSRESIEVEK
ncbi:MAG: nicotinamide mononucleotide transporter [Lachnospiraceae bacterium]|nr:nicotinamide mononucleotide transporter [Lachnospiraceae bacterium]